MSSIALKITSLLVRTVAKPMANAIKGQAKQHPKFRTTCIAFAQFIHRSDVNLRMKLLGETNVRVRPLNDAKAIDSGANFLAESFIFSVAGGLILFESYRSHKKEVARRESVADDIQALQDEIEWMKRHLKSKHIVDEEYHLPKDMKPSILKQLSEDSTQGSESGASVQSTNQSAQSTVQTVLGISGQDTDVLSSPKDTSSESVICVLSTPSAQPLASS